MKLWMLTERLTGSGCRRRKPGIKNKAPKASGRDEIQYYFRWNTGFERASVFTLLWAAGSVASANAAWQVCESHFQV